MTVDLPPTSELAYSSSWKYLRPQVIIWSGVVFVGISIVALLVVPQLLLDHYLRNVNVDEASLRLAIGSTTQVVLFSLGGFIALVGVVLSLSRHRLELDTSQRDRLKEDRRVSELVQQRRIDAERELRTRFTQAVALLSDPDKPTTRQAGVYALGALADDWINHGRLDERQVCIDVICGYLRSRWDPKADNADDERRIRTAAFELIGGHLRFDSDQPSWDGAVFNISGAFIDFNVNFSKMALATGRISLEHATIAGGTSDFREARLYGGTVSFIGAKLSGGTIVFNDSRLSGGLVDFGAVELSGGEVQFFGAKLSGGTVSFFSATLTGGAIEFSAATLSGGTISFNDATLSKGDINFHGATLSGSAVDFSYVTLSGGKVQFFGATLSAGMVDFSYSELLGGTVHYQGAMLSGGAVDFTYAKLLRGTVYFKNTTLSGSKIDFSEAEFSGGTVEINGQTFRDHPVVLP